MNVETAIITEPLSAPGELPIRALAAFAAACALDKALPGLSKERTGMRSMQEILPLPVGAWQEPCGLRYSESGF